MRAWLGGLWRTLRLPASPVTLEALLGRGFVAIDLETTGLDTRRDTIVSVAALRVVDGAAHEGYVTLVNPGRPIPPASTAIHGITDAMVTAAPGLGEALVRLEAACGADLVVGHSLAFDLAVIGRERRARGLPPPANPSLCTMRLAAALHPGWQDVGLDVVAERLGISIPDRHTARGDAVAAARIFLALLAEAGRRGIRTLDELSWLERTAKLHA
jgi:DNA polymerase III epsilon subunit-like protein